MHAAPDSSPGCNRHRDGRPMSLEICDGLITVTDTTPLITGVDFVCIPAQDSTP